MTSGRNEDECANHSALAWEPPYAENVALRKKKSKKKNLTA